MSQRQKFAGGYEPATTYVRTTILSILFIRRLVTAYTTLSLKFVVLFIRRLVHTLLLFAQVSQVVQLAKSF